VERVVVHEKQDGEDTSEPRIVDVTVNNISVKYSLIIDDFNPTINVIAFDESRIKSVKIDTFYAVVKNGYSWESKVPISHFGTQIRIVVTDESNNSSRYSINLRQNYAPSIIGDKILFDSCFVGDTIRGSVNATDSNPSDLPLLRYSSSTPGVMIDSISGKYMWVASTERTQNELQFKVSDAVNSTEFKRFIYVLKDSTPKPSSIRFLTTADDFPSILIAGRDTLKGDVMITGGNNPVMSVYKPKNTSNIPVVTGSKLQWLPQEEDTGMQKITLVASDSSGDSAFFNLSITVLSQKDTFATSSNWLGLTNPDKSLNLSSSENSNILTVRIIGYSGDYSGFDVQYFLLGKVYHDSIVNSVCQIALDPNAKAYGRDSIVVIVTHKGAISRRLVKQLDYGNPPDIPLITSPLSYSTVAEDSFTVKWQCSDPDNNPLSYTIYIAAENDIFKPLGTTNKTSFICSGLVKAGKSYLRVVASDGKTSTESELVVINLLPPNRVMIKNTASEIPKYIEVDSTWTLPLKTSNGIPPFVFTVVSNAAVKPYIDSLNNLDWTPSVADTGKKSLKVKLVDSIGNCDSIDAQVWILSKRCSPQLTWSSTNSINGGLDLHTTSVPETLYFNIEDDDPTEIESYSIKTKINHIEGVQSLLSKKTFKVIVFPVQSNSSTDTITVTVTDMWGLQDSVLIPVFYGNAPYNPLPLTPAINEEISGGTVNFSWDCEDPDGDKLNYTLYMGKEPDSLITGIVTDKKSMQITGLTPSEYYFKIIAT
ncbi:MAG: hypothetical protein GX640_20160, partial [Fibrobacter sp.]|nr:hypothetical protein [Fibrobacter sp.]